MSRPAQWLCTAVTMIATAFAAGATERYTEHTWALEPGETRPPATLADAAWLVGAWCGDAFGSRFEETWNPPSAGSMVGMFKLYGDDGVAFYEIMLLTVDEGTLSLKVRHFNADFTAWEDRAEYVNFRLVRKEANALHFGGLSFYRRDAGTIDGYIVMRSGDDIAEQHLRYERRPASGCDDSAASQPG